MTDLPRFHRGQVGELTFEHVNEITRRLDALQPLVEQSSVLTTMAMDTKSLVFISYANKLPAGPGGDRYQWREVLFDTADQFVTEDSPDWPDAEEFGVQIRKGGIPDPDTGEIPDTYAVRADPLLDFESGLCITFALRRIDRKPRHVLVPLPSTVKPSGLFVVGSSEGVTTVSTPAGDFQAVRYIGQAIGVAADGSFDDAIDGTLIDLSYHEINLPIHNTSAVMEYHTLVDGTVVTPSFVAPGYAYLGTLPRLDFTC